MGTNMNGVVGNDRSGTLVVGAPGSPINTTRLTVNGRAMTAGNLGVGTGPHDSFPLFVRGHTELASFPGTPVTALVGSSQAYTTANNGSGIGFTADYAAGEGMSTIIGVVSAVKESTSSGNYSGALTFGTRATGASGAIERMRIRSNGEVVIGPAGGTGQRLNVNGDVTVQGNIAARYQDVAEWVPALVDMAPGTVVVLDRGADNRVMPSATAYDTTVAGVVSEQPGVILGVAAATSEKVATTGRVLVRVDATQRPIRVGDLLVTSDRPGTAMASEALDVAGTKLHRPGTIIGKALQPLAEGEGEILVLLSLQ